MRIGPFELSFRSHNSRSSRQRIREFGGERAGIQYVGDLIIELESLRGGASNRYISRREQVAESVRKYRGLAAKGCLLTKNILNTRSAFIVGRGLSVTGWAEDSAEAQFIKEFQRRNRFNLAYLRQLGRERCFEGQVLLGLQPSADGVPALRYVSWLDTGYEVKTSPFDYTLVEAIKWVGQNRDFSIPPGQSAFFKFDTRMNSTEGTPMFAGALSALEELDDAVALLRTINAIAAKPTPYFRFDNENDADAFQQRLKTLNWKMGDALAGAGEAMMLQLGYGPYTSIENQAQLLVKLISGSTSVPPHYFGFSELLNNRSVADDISAMYVRLSETETDEWSNGFTDLIGRAMAMYNAQFGKTLNHQGGRIEVEQISQQQFQEVMQVWLPVWLGGGITTETLLEKLPGIDEKTEAAKVIAELKTRGAQTPGEILPEERRAAEQVFRAYSMRGGQ